MSTNKVKLIATCVFCSEKSEAEAIFPDGWDHYNGEIWLESGDIMCPDHKIINEFAHSQCPGCISGWGDDCPLFESFAYSSKMDITIGDLTKIEEGICPKRINGTFGIFRNDDTQAIEPMDLSERSTTESGIALAQAIREYIRKWG